VSALSVDIETKEGLVVCVVQNLSLRQSDMFFAGTLSLQYLGTIGSESLPRDLRLALDEYRDLIDEQVFSLLDEARERVLSFGIVARLHPGGQTSKILDLQLNNRSVLLVLAK
jgi:hypothetical protein